MVVLGILGLFTGMCLILGSEAKIIGQTLYFGGPVISGSGLIWLTLQLMYRK
jgi:hypothetical protein